MAWLLISLCLPLLAFAAYPPLGVEIKAEHPLILFGVDTSQSGAEGPAAAVLKAFQDLPPFFQPFSALILDAPVSSPERPTAYTAMLPAIQDAHVPVALTLYSRARPQRYAPAALEELLRAFTEVKGVYISGVDFDVYPWPPERVNEADPVVLWLAEVIEVAAKYGRFTALALDGLNWPRAMANVQAAPLITKMRQCRAYVIPLSLERGDHHLARLGAAMGIWLEGTAAQWGVASDSRWYQDAGFMGRNLFGQGGVAEAPAHVYRAMMMNGAMTGASVYAFVRPEDLWRGVKSVYWKEAIAPTLELLIENALIAREDFVRAKTPVAYQLSSAITPKDFHVNLRDIDPVLDEGNLIRAAYGVQRPGQIPELIPNSSRCFRIPMISYHAGEAVRSQFQQVFQAGQVPNAEAWTSQLAPYFPPLETGEAFVAEVGRGLFLMNTAENTDAVQRFSLAAAPSPITGITAVRQAGGILLTWPFREGDVSYRVFRKTPQEASFQEIAAGLDQREFLDPAIAADSAVEYTVTALTNEKSPYSGALGWGEYRLLSAVESRRGESVVLAPSAATGEARPVEEPLPPEPAPWWPSYNGLSETERAMAQAIVERIEFWDRVFSQGDLAGVLDNYATDYQDPQGWDFQYVKRAYQWFFEGWQRFEMHRQIRQWDFSAYESEGLVHVLIYCRLTGYAISDASGRQADVCTWLPRTSSSEVWLTWKNTEGVWRIQSSNPAVPNFKDLLAPFTSPYAPLGEGPDIYP